MTRTAGVEDLRGKVRLAAVIMLFLGILLFLNYGVERLA